jgi:hypothetical protein
MTLETTGLIFDTNADTSVVQNVLMIHSDAADLGQYANPETFVIVYDHSADRETLLSVLDSRFHHIQRFAFAFHYTESRSLLLNNAPWFTDDDFLPTNTPSPNAQLILDIIARFSVSQLDVLACNTLNDTAWKRYYDTVYAKTGIVIGASDNNTGNLKYGGDWILESTHTDVQTIYFTEAIANYSTLLATYTSGGLTYTYSGTTAYISASSGITGALVIPSTVLISSTTYTVNAIGTSTDSTGVFQANTNITSVVIPGTVLSIGKSAFFNCSNLTSITLNSGLTTIYDSAFLNCSLLSKVVIPSTVSAINPYAFASNYSMNTISILGSPTIANYAFQNNYLSRISIIGAAVLAANAFISNANPLVIYLNSGVSMTNDPFAGCTSVSTLYTNNTSLSLTNSTVLSGKTKTLMYFDANYVSYLISSGTNAYANGSISTNAVSSISIPSTVSIQGTTYTVNAIGSGSDSSGNGVFQFNTNITSVSIPGTVSVVNPYAFAGCTNLTSISLANGVSTLAGNSFAPAPTSNWLRSGARRATTASPRFPCSSKDQWHGASSTKPMAPPSGSSYQSKCPLELPVTSPRNQPP